MNRIKKPLTFKSSTVRVLTSQELYASRVVGGWVEKCSAGNSTCSTNYGATIGVPSCSNAF